MPSSYEIFCNMRIADLIKRREELLEYIRGYEQRGRLDHFELYYIEDNDVEESFPDLSYSRACKELAELLRVLSDKSFNLIVLTTEGVDKEKMNDACSRILTGIRKRPKILRAELVDLEDFLTNAMLDYLIENEKVIYKVTKKYAFWKIMEDGK